MLIDFRPHARLRAESPVDLGASVLPVVAALSQSKADLSEVRVVCDWGQYRNNFREVVEIRPILRSSPSAAAQSGALTGDVEVAVDVRRAPDSSLCDMTTSLLRHQADRLFLEDWAAGSHSCIWRFNSLYWSALELWEKATGRNYEQALPGGESDARNRAAATDLIGDLMAAWDRLDRVNALPEELYVVELGVGNGNQAKVFLDE